MFPVNCLWIIIFITSSHATVILITYFYLFAFDSLSFFGDWDLNPGPPEFNTSSSTKHHFSPHLWLFINYVYIHVSGSPSSSNWYRWGLWLRWSLFLQVQESCINIYMNMRHVYGSVSNVIEPVTRLKSGNSSVSVLEGLRTSKHSHLFPLSLFSIVDF